MAIETRPTSSRILPRADVTPTPTTATTTTPTPATAEVDRGTAPTTTADEVAALQAPRLEQGAALLQGNTSAVDVAPPLPATGEGAVDVDRTLYQADEAAAVTTPEATPVTGSLVDNVETLRHPAVQAGLLAGIADKAGVTLPPAGALPSSSETDVQTLMTRARAHGEVDDSVQGMTLTDAEKAGLLNDDTRHEAALGIRERLDERNALYAKVGGPENLARLEDAWSAMPATEQQEVMGAARLADAQGDPLVDFFSGVGDGLKDTVGDSIVTAKDFIFDGDKRAAMIEGFQTVSLAMSTTEGQASVLQALQQGLGEKFDAVAARGNAYVAGYIVGAGAGTIGTTLAGGAAVVKAGSVVAANAPRIAAAATAALDTARKLAPGAAALGGAWLAGTEDAQAALPGAVIGVGLSAGTMLSAGTLLAGATRLTGKALAAAKAQASRAVKNPVGFITNSTVGDFATKGAHVAVNIPGLNKPVEVAISASARQVPGPHGTMVTEYVPFAQVLDVEGGKLATTPQGRKAIELVEVRLQHDPKFRATLLTHTRDALAVAAQTADPRREQLPGAENLVQYLLLATGGR